MDDEIKNCLIVFEKNPSHENYMKLAWKYCKLLRNCLNTQNMGDVYDIMLCIDALDCRVYKYSDAILDTINKILHKFDFINSEILDQFFQFVTNFKIDHNSKLMRGFMSGMMRHSLKWDAFLEFCDWWDFNNFRPDDFCNKIVLGSSFACNAYQKYAKKLIRNSPSLYDINFFIDFVMRISDTPFSIYANMYIANYLLILGFPREVVLRIYRPLMKQKFQKPWTWYALSSVFSHDDIRYEACLYYALENVPYVKDSSNIQLMRSIKALKKRKQCSDALPNYKQICHNIFEGLKDVDNKLWSEILSQLIELKKNVNPLFC